MDAMQQIKVALSGSQASGLLDLLVERLQQSPLPMKPNVQLPQVYTLSPPVPPPQTIPIVGVTTPMPEEASDDETDRGATMAPDPQEALLDSSKHCHIIPTPAPILDVPLTSSTSSYPIAVVLELVILAETNPEFINRPSGGKDYLCHLCSFQHTDSITTIVC